MTNPTIPTSRKIAFLLVFLSCVAGARKSNAGVLKYLDWMRKTIIEGDAKPFVRQSRAGVGEEVYRTGLRTVSKPEDPQDAPERRARVQPDVPDDYAAVPFIESAPPPVLTADERERGYLLFQRPIMDPVHPNTRPLPHERLQSLTGFATPGEFEPVTFSIYPVRDLKNLRVRTSALTGPDGEIPISNIRSSSAKATTLTVRISPSTWPTYPCCGSRRPRFSKWMWRGSSRCPNPCCRSASVSWE